LPNTKPDFSSFIVISYEKLHMNIGTWQYN